MRNPEKKSEQRELHISSIVDRSNYLRALIILIKQDKNVWDHEMKLFFEEGSSLGFEKNFCENSLNNLLLNINIDPKPPMFFDKKIAEKLLIKGIQVINDDIKIHPEKLAFLEVIASINGLLQVWQTDLIKQLKKK
jgi:hypothetical protein